MHWGDFVGAQQVALGPLVLGVDPSPDHAPTALGTAAASFLRGYVEVLLEAGQGIAGFVKFQSAFFEAFGSEGVHELALGMASARERKYGVILDVKRGDIGSTAEAYAQAYLSPRAHGGSDLEADCVTLNPFLGPETMEPFLARVRQHGKGVFVLVRTSNPGSGWVQDCTSADSDSVSERLADQVGAWAEETVGSSGVGSVGAVLGATFPEEAARLRRRMGHAVLLSPGVGSQGGAGDAMARLATRTSPVLVSASRAIARVDDRSMPLEDYRRLVRQRIQGFAAAVT